MQDYTTKRQFSKASCNVKSIASLVIITVTFLSSRNGTKMYELHNMKKISIFLSFRFYVKAILEAVEVQKMAILRALNFAILGNFSFQIAKFQSL